MKNLEEVIVALDVADRTTALEYVDELSRHVNQFKVGMQLFYAEGARLIDDIRNYGGEVFLDLKMHDIPNTVAGASESLRENGIWMTNVHASGGPEMMSAAREALPDTKVLAVTVLTSLDKNILSKHWGINESIDQIVRRWAKSAQEEGLDGVVCSPKEIEIVREETGDDFLIVTPGIRPTWAAKGDQRRITTPADAVERGADYLVIGRPITGADNPVKAVRKIRQEISQG